MREAERDPFRIHHMIESAKKILKFSKDKSLQDIIEDEILFFAIVKNIEIFGEAAFMLSKEFKENHPELPWRQITGMRHVLVHEYYNISPVQVYQVFTKDIPLLLPILENLNSKISGISDKDL